MADRVLPSKLVPERITVRFNFLPDVDWGELLVSAVCEIKVLSGVDGSPQDLLLGPPAIAGPVISQKLQGGLPGVVYNICMRPLGSSGKRYEQTAKLAVLFSESQVPLFNAKYFTSRPYALEGIDGIVAGSLEVPEGRFFNQWYTAEADSIGGTYSIVSAALTGGLITYVAPAEDAIASLGLDILAGELYGGLKTYAAVAEDFITTNMIVMGGELYGGLIIYDAPSEDFITTSYSITAGELT